MRSTARCRHPPIRSDTGRLCPGARHLRSHPIPRRRTCPRPCIRRSRCKPRLGGCRAGSSSCSAPPRSARRFPSRSEGSRSATSSSAPDLSADMFEKWIGFLAIACSAIALPDVDRASSPISPQAAAIRPLRNLGEGLTRMREGRLRHPIPASGPAGNPAELRGGQRTRPHACSRLSQDNRNLLRKIVSLQDDERRDIARELHDELGPLLFGIRANTVALLEAVPPDQETRRPGARASCNRSRRCSRPTAASSTGCGRSTSRSWDWRGASRRCCGMRRRRRPASN